MIMDHGGFLTRGVAALLEQEISPQPPLHPTWHVPRIVNGWRRPARRGCNLSALSVAQRRRRSKTRSELGPPLGVLLGLHRKATAIAGLGRLTAMSGTPTTTRGACKACDVACSINAEPAPDGKGVSLSFGIHGVANR